MKLWNGEYTHLSTKSTRGWEVWQLIWKRLLWGLSFHIRTLLHAEAVNEYNSLVFWEVLLPFSHCGPWYAALQKQLPVLGSQPVECSWTQSHSLEQPALCVHLGQAEGHTRSLSKETKKHELARQRQHSFMFVWLLCKEYTHVNYTCLHWQDGQLKVNGFMRLSVKT